MLLFKTLYRYSYVTFPKKELVTGMLLFQRSTSLQLRYFTFPKKFSIYKTLNQNKAGKI